MTNEDGADDLIEEIAREREEYARRHFPPSDRTRLACGCFACHRPGYGVNAPGWTITNTYIDCPYRHEQGDHVADL